MRVVTIAVAFLLMAVGACAQTPEIHISKDNRTIGLTTSAQATAQADVATVHIGFTVYAADEQQAYAAGAQRSNAIFDALTKAGVAKKDIESTSQGISPVQTNDKQKPDRKFQVEQGWTVKCAAADAAKILHAAIGAGANDSGNIEWDVTDEDALEGQAAAKALKNARAVAAAMAAGLGVKLGPLVYASNEAPERPGPRPMFARSMAAAAPASQPLAIAPGKVEKSATVTAVFAIE